MNLASLGWGPFQQQHWSALGRPDLVPARVMAAHRDRFEVEGETWAGSAAVARQDAAWPTTGDWVGLRLSEDGEQAWVEVVLPRRGAFVRKQAGQESRSQVVAANLDEVWIVTAMTEEFSPRRLERYLSLAWNGGARPLIILSKSDLGDDPEALVAVAESVSPGVDVVTVSALEGAGLDTLADRLQPGRTVALLGSSGVGKSTLVNALAGREILATSGIRESDGKGRHTTTGRQIVPLANGALLMDTPGMRELGLWDAEAGLARTFADIEALARDCRFADCRHDREPGCAVQAAVAAGGIDAHRVSNYRKLLAEQQRIERQSDVLAQREQRRQDRVLHKAIRRYFKDKR